MTRINLIPVSELMDQHLMAEYREIRHVGPALQRSLKSKKGFDKKSIPVEFTLNTGHVKHFYDKGRYLYNRYQDICEELKCRGFQIQEVEFDTSLFPEGFFNDYVPTQRALELIRERIALRISEKPNWYKKTKGKTE